MAFTKGASGNPSGRPHGETPQMRIRREIEKEMPDILATVVNAAKGGDMAAAKLLMDKVSPSIKAQALPVTVPAGNGLADTGNNILGAALSAQIPPDVAQTLLNALANQAKLVEVTELAQRLDRIEQLILEKK